MIFRIPKGKHRSKPWRFRLWFGRNKWKWSVAFTESCAYEPDLEGDTNKLIGVGFFPGHHTSSLRIGWRFNPVKDMIELSLYSYVNGNRAIQSICHVHLGETVTIELMQEKSMSWAQVSDYKGRFLGTAALLRDRQYFSYGLWPYFGGQAKAPHKMKIKIDFL